MSKIRNSLKSVRVKLFITLSLVILAIITFLILVNNFVFGQYYLYSKTKALESLYEVVNDYYNNEQTGDISSKLEKTAIQNNFDILIKDDQNVNVYTSNKDFFSTFSQMTEMTNNFNSGLGETIAKDDNYTIKKMRDTRNGISFIVLSSKLDNGYLLYARIPITSIQESVKISNNFLYLMAGLTILIAAVIVSYVTRKFTDPILELDKIAKKWQI